LAERRFRFSLRHKVVLAVVSCVLAPVLVMGAYLFNRSEEVLREKARETLANSVFRRTAQIEDWLSERRNESTHWSTSYILSEATVAAQRRGPEQARGRAELQEFLNSIIKDYGVYESLMVVDLQGNVLSATGDEEVEPWAREALRGQPGAATIVTPLRRSARLGRPTMLAFRSVQSGERAVGYLAQRFDLRELSAFVAAGARNEPPTFWLLDEGGGAVVKNGHVLDQPGAEHFPAPLEQESGEGPLAGEQGLWAIQKMQGGLAGYVAATVPASVAYQPLADSRVRLFRVGVPSVLFVCLLALIVGRRLVAPILALSEGARKVAAGDLNLQLPLSGNDELRDLTQSFNDMVHKLRDSQHELAEVHRREALRNEELRAANLKLEALAITDGLTGLYNRRHFQDQLEKEIARAEQGGWPLSLLFIDLDRFKQYNDRWGHLEGDAELRRVAAQVIKSVRSTDTAYRYGGEELAVLLPSCPKEQAAKVAEKVRQAVSAGTQKPGRFGGRTTVSIGVATFPSDGRVPRAVVDTADAALYEAKSGGRDRVVVAGESPPPTARRTAKPSP
jgi:diguanylate cyclase (GGDEF)-like protein